MRKLIIFGILVCSLLFTTNSYAGVWLELLHAPCWTGDGSNDMYLGSAAPQDDVAYGQYQGSADCFNKDFNGGGQRTVLSFKVFEPWKYGTFFMFYDITGPTNGALANVTDNEKGGFFGAMSGTLSGQAVYQALTGERLGMGYLGDVSVKYELEHVGKFGALHYYGLQWDLRVPFLDFASLTTVLRDDWVFKGVDLQLGGAAQKTFDLAGQRFLAGGFFAWGVFGEGESKNSMAGSEGRNFFLSQVQLLWNVGQLAKYFQEKPEFFNDRLWIGVEGQVSVNRYLIEGKSENLLQGMVRWNI
jgi:hypothetical protein